MHNHRYPCCLRGIVPNDYNSNTPAIGAIHSNHEREHFNNTSVVSITTCRNSESKQQDNLHGTQYSTNRTFPPSNELLQHTEQQSSKYFDVRCQNLAIHSVCNPLKVNCCKRKNKNCTGIYCCQEKQIQRTNQLSSSSAYASHYHHHDHHPFNIHNQVNCNQCCCRSCYSFNYNNNSCCFAAAALFSAYNCNKCITTASENNDSIYEKISSYTSNYYQNHNDISDNAHLFSVTSESQQSSDLEKSKNFNNNKNEITRITSSVMRIDKNHTNIITNDNNISKKNMSSAKGDNKCIKKELGIWTEYTKLLLGKSNHCSDNRKSNSKKRNSRLETTTAITSIFSSVFLLVTLLPSFTFAGGKS